MIEKMSIHRALAELKNYNKKINLTIQEPFITTKKKSSKKINGFEVEDYKKMIQANFDKAKAIIENKKKLKSAVVLSNAQTLVTIAGEEYTVAEAIERKNLLIHEKNFLEQLKKQYCASNDLTNQINENLSSNLEKYLSVVLGEKDKRNSEDIELHTKAFYEREEFELIDPMNIKEYINKLENSIMEFESNVDYILSESNATTFIEVDLCS